MNLIISTLENLLPPKRKITPSGWTSFNAVCCVHQGESRDTKKRGGILINQGEQFQYHCFNCGFKAGWSKGKLLSGNTKKLFVWLGLAQDDINKLSLYALSIKDQEAVLEPIKSLDLDNRQLPDMTMTVEDWLASNPEPVILDKLTSLIEYITDTRGMHWDWYTWYWSASPGYQDRVIIPFYHQGRIVGHTGRKIGSGKPKYLSDSQSGYVFNLDRQTADRSLVIVVEGQFDAIAIDGVAIMTNEPNDIQTMRINSLGREVCVVPDRDHAGSRLITAAINNGWSVSFPPWENHIKDVSDAVKHYGRLYTLFTILQYREQSRIKIQLLQKTQYHNYEKS